ncbi:MAG: PLD nuclease N-terminal domain-containing protein [Propionibacteriaceae bacterium]
MSTPWIAFVALSVVVSIVSIVLILVSPAADVRMLRKPLWIVIALVPILGGVAWLAFGRPKRRPVGKRVAKERRPRGKRQKISADRQVVVDRLTSDIRTRSARTSGPSAISPESPGGQTARAARSAQSAAERSASSPATASYREE